MEQVIRSGRCPHQAFKKILSLFLSLIMLLSITAPLNLTANADETEGYYTYTVEDGEATITDCDDSISGDVTIPATLGGYPVTSIGEHAFYYCESLTSIAIPNSVISIGDDAFYNCTSLTNIIIPDSVTSIGNWAIANCTSLTSIIIPNSVTSIGDRAFSGCIGLTSITIPNSVTSIGEGAFTWCDCLESIIVDSSNQYYSSQDGVLFDKNKTTLIRYPIGNTRTSYTIPNGVTSIGYRAFDDGSNLTSVTIPDTITSIGNYAFSYCRGLTDITIPDSVTSIGDLAFYVCEGLTSITIPDAVTSIGEAAFAWCTSLTSVIIGNSVANIGESAFYDCISLTDVYYNGSKADWSNISIDEGNECLTEAAIHYSQSAPEEPSTQPSTEPSTQPTTQPTAPAAPTTAPPAATAPTKPITNTPTQPIATVPPTPLAAQSVVTTQAAPAGAAKVGNEWVDAKQKNTKIKNLTNAKKSFKATWSKVTGVAGYQIQYSTDKKFKKNTKAVTVKGNKTTSTTVKKLKANKKYYVRIRTYKNVKLSGTTVKVYSKWSSAKTVTTK